MWQVRLEKKAEKDISRLPQQIKKRILAFLPVLQTNPYIGKKLDGEYDGYYAYRIWPYRIIYKLYKKILLILIVRIGHRQGVYK